jgi:catechol 2,3-dioxygenase-like lactoylglutathione lyase family enzyme
MALNGLQQLDRIRLNCRDPQRSAAFFVEALGFGADSPAGSERGLGLTLGSNRLELAEMAPDASAGLVAAPGWNLAFQHFAVAVDDMRTAFGRLQSATGWMAISTGGPQRLPASSGGVTAYKFRDPDGHPLELIAFPEGSAFGAIPRIDHSAISVADTAASVAFYEGLGFEVCARSFNHGPEQERLDCLANARVEVTALTLPHVAGPHLELLCYQGAYNRKGVAAQAGDLAATRLVLSADDRNSLERLNNQYTNHIVSAADRKLLLRDPDGHLLQIEAAS